VAIQDAMSVDTDIEKVDTSDMLHVIQSLPDQIETIAADILRVWL
jgi:hypothetical protein